MTPPHDKSRTRLLAETFHDDWSTGSASEFARHAAAHARRRRRLRRAVAVTGCATAIVLAFLVTRRHVPPERLVTMKPLAFEIISDEEFMTLWRDRPVLVLPQQDGTKQMLAFDR